MLQYAPKLRESLLLPYSLRWREASSCNLELSIQQSPVQYDKVMGANQLKNLDVSCIGAVERILGQKVGLKIHKIHVC